MTYETPTLAGSAVTRPATLRGALARANDYAQAARAPNTRRSYDACLRHFEGWASREGLGVLPVSGDLLAVYLSEYAETSTTSTLANRIAAIRAAHREAGWPMPESPALGKVWAGIRRTFGRPAVAKAALCLADLRRVLDAMPDTVVGKRDRALMLLGFAGALRRSELAALELEGGQGPAILAFVREGLEIRLSRSKADQEGRGAVVAVPLGHDPATCAATAVRAWLEAADIMSGPIFRRVTRTGCIGANALTPQVVATVVKAAVERVGLDPATFAGHSLRAGLITSAAVNGAAPDVLMAHARHARFDTTSRYIRDANRFSRNAATLAGL